MLNSETLEVAIGMAFLFLAVSLICTAIKEWLEGIFKWRAMDLERALRTLLADPDGTTTGQLLRHPLLYSLFPGDYDPAQLRSSWLTPGKESLHMRLSQRRNLPSYIPAGQFAVALLDCVARGPTSSDGADTTAAAATLHPGPLSVAALRQSAMALASPHLQRAVLAALDHSAGDLATARSNIERWFNGTMDRASGWYKRRTQALLFLLGLAAAVVMNIDALHVMQHLTADKAYREVVVKEAGTVAAPGEPASAVQLERMRNARSALERVGMPIGWRAWRPASAAAGSQALPLPTQLCVPLDGSLCRRAQWLGADWLEVLCGWLLTAFAVMLGAPFWFDVLNKFIVIRSTVKPHEKSAEAASEDRQPVDAGGSPPGNKQ
ncbi:MAG: hypothetical protein KGL99_16050 [Burkholderiales bacterium]|nr:hypothetical protein [Burkholderiales bacterium]MDE2628659.1 hypothetical protein [Burkholderiales bacterium]